MLKRLKMCCGSLFRFIHVMAQLIYGIWKISKLNPPIISIFGGARIPGEDRYFKMAHELSRKFAQNGISVLTGGGPGIMEAASCGAVLPESKDVQVMGIGVTDLGEKPNSCVQEYFALRYFFARKWLLTRYSSAFIVFPGGFGTLDEVAEVITLIQTNKLARVPIVFYGVEYWEPFLKWLFEEPLKHGAVDKNDLALFTLTDDLHEIFCIVRDECELQP